MTPKAIALTILKKYHRSLSDGISMIAAYIDMDFEQEFDWPENPDKNNEYCGR